MSDLISRQAAQTELMTKCERYTLARESHGMGRVEWSSDLISVGDAMDAIRDLPSAQPERKGKWVGYGGDWLKTMCKCSKCGAMIGIDEKYRNFFCYHCGARMDVEQDE